METKSINVDKSATQSYKELYKLARPFIDADSHIEESEEVFKYIDKEYEHRRPTIVDIEGVIKHRPTRNKVWLVDGEIRPKLMGQNPSCYASPPTSDYAKSKPVSVSVQALMDPDEYIECMQTIGLDVSVLYPTLMLHPLTRDPGFEEALARAYNSFMGERCGRRSENLKWAAVLPMRNPDAAAREVRRAKSLGASTCMLLSTVGDIPLHDRRFDIVYETLCLEKMPMSIHVGWPHDSLNDSISSIPASLVLHFEAGMLHGMFSVLAGGILDRFPELKVAFVEAGAVWLPTFLDRAEKWRKTPTAEIWLAEKGPVDYLRENQVFFTVEGDEPRLEEFVALVGENRILGSADFPHVHYEGGKLSETFKDLVTHPGFTNQTKARFLGKNSLDFYRM
ncbi:amidohydrolase family protein [uncultured Marinobacter sp.]|uniref:amidohydrolase family protein n=1 Tax=uncultured Marinobacter sp. TaxID=187379 RepID=UPI0030DDB53C